MKTTLLPTLLAGLVASFTLQAQVGVPSPTGSQSGFYHALTLASAEADAPSGDAAGGCRYYADKPNGGPDWGLRFAITLLFPK